MTLFWTGNTTSPEAELSAGIGNKTLPVDSHPFPRVSGVVIVDAIAPDSSSDGWEGKVPLKITAGQESLTDSSEGTEITMSAPRKLDKYGFILNIDANGLVYESKTNNHNHATASGSGGVTSNSDTNRNEQRERKWNYTLNNWERRRSKKLKERLRKGVPDAVRGKVWLALGGGIREPGLYQQIVQKTSDAMLTSFKELASRNNPEALDTHQNDTMPTTTALVSSEEQEQHSPKPKPTKNVSPGSAKESSLSKEEYARSPAFRAVQDTIERDIHRTFPRHNLFYEEENPRADDAVTMAACSLLGVSGMCDPELASLIVNLDRDIKTINVSGGTTTPLSSSSSSLNGNTKSMTPNGQAALRRVLRAYSYYDREVSYCQGMNFIAGMFLTVMSEEEAFWLLVSVMHDKPCEMRGMFGEGMRETHKVLFVAEGLIHMHLPRVARHFDKENIHVTMYATQWLLTQFTSSFKFDLVTRVWDAFLGEGWKIIYRVMLALLQQWQSQLLRMSFEDILTFFRELPERVNGNTIMETALRINLKTRQIVKLEKEFYEKEKRK